MAFLPLADGAEAAAAGEIEQPPDVRVVGLGATVAGMPTVRTPSSTSPLCTPVPVPAAGPAAGPLVLVPG
ncbi:hypothetical protein WDV86_07810, partial [Pseudokineococcus sp. 1T1Z-3]|uniref:hypothetical protein n=1 Tax=Pseudokineococcus sp. 1T1Z-3 TaxID=3132745 RepID=UPI0030A9734B